MSLRSAWRRFRASWFVHFRVAATPARLAVLAMAALALAAQTGADATAAHRYFDAVLYPRFTATLNEFSFKHPSKPDHAATFDVADRKRWRDARAAWRELDDAAKTMGY